MGFVTDFDLVVRIAFWSGQIAIVATMAVVVSVLVMRWRFKVRQRQGANLLKAWRPIFAETAHMYSEDLLRDLPKLQRRDLEPLLREWNVVHDSLAGGATRGLNSLARHLGFDQVANRMIKRNRLQEKLLATATLGHLHDASAWESLADNFESNNTLLSLMSARALVEINPEKAVPLIIARIATRKDWPVGRIASLFMEAGPYIVRKPLITAISNAPPDEAAKLLRFLRVIPTADAAHLIRELLEKTGDNYIVAACLKVLDDPSELPLIRKLCSHSRWHIRMLAVKLLGRIGEEEDKRFIVSALEDREWWVRYRAAQALAQLPWVNPKRLKLIKSLQADRYARDILEQVMAEIRFS